MNQILDPSFGREQLETSTGVLPTNNRPKSLRSACDYCHQSKVRCTGGGVACARCKRDNIPCHYSYPVRVGKPKGSKNKKTIEKLNALARAAGRDREAEIASHVDNNSNTAQHGGVAAEITHQAPNLADNLQNINSNYPINTATTSNLIEDTSQDDFPAGLFADFSSMDDGPMMSPRQTQGPSTIQNTFTPLSPSESLPPLPNFLADDQLDAEGEDEFDDAIFSMPEDGDGLASPESSITSSGSRTRKSTRSLSSMDWLLAGLAESPFEDSVDLACGCVQKQASYLCELKEVERQPKGPRLDATMRLSSNIFRSIEESSGCKACVGDIQLLHLNVMVLRLFFRLIGALCKGRGGMSVRFGSYSMNQEECAWMNTLIVTRLLAKSKATVEYLRQRISGLVPSLQSADSEYFGQVLRGLAASLHGYARQLDKQRANVEPGDERRRSRHESIMSRYI